MRKDDVKTIILIFLILLLISAISVLGINVYKNIMYSDNNDKEALYEGNDLLIPNGNISNNNSVVEDEGGILNQVASSNENNQNSGSNTFTTKDEGYYYKQLNSYAKIIYEKLKSNKENLKTGTYIIEFENTFDDLLSTQNGSELLQGYYQSAMETYLYDNPDVFFLDPTKMYINIRTIKKIFSTRYEVYIDSGNNANYYADGISSKQQILQYEAQIEIETQRILSEVKGKTNYEKMKIIHDYLVDNISYEETISKNNIYNIYGALVNKEAVCEGYSKAFKYLMDQVNIEAVIVTGEATDSNGAIQKHAWNYVNFNNRWYAIDVTWDDPILIGGGTVPNKYKYKYFLKGSLTMNIDHVEKYTFVENGKVYSYPNLSLNNYE